MKTKIGRIFLLAMFCSSGVFAQWETIYYPFPTPTLPWLNALQFHDFNNGIAVGHKDTWEGCILRTKDNGTTWDTAYSTIDTMNFRDVVYTDSATVFTIGDRGYCCNNNIGIIAKSIDFGST